MKLVKCHTREERIQLLTLIPEQWAREKAISFFSVTEYMVRTARNVKKGKGMLRIPDSIHKHGLSDSIQNSPWQSTNAEAFAKACLCFLVSAPAKKC